MKKNFILAMGLVSITAFAQQDNPDLYGRVGINTNEPKASLDITRHTEIPAENPQGLLLPHLTKDQRDAFNQEKLVNGLMIFNTTKNCIDWYDGEKWQCTDGSNIDYSPVNTTKNKTIKADVWDRTHYIGSFNHNGANIDGIINNTTNKLTLQIPYNQATVGGDYNEINIKRTIKDRNGKNVLLTLNIPAGTFAEAKGFLPATIIVGDGSTTDTYSVKQLNAFAEEILTTFTFRINGNVSNVNLVASGGVLDRMFGKETNNKLEHQFIYVPVSVYPFLVDALPNSGKHYEKKWLNNNLGANYAKLGNNQHNKQAVSKSDHNAYGYLYEYNKDADGHEVINWESSVKGAYANPDELRHSSMEESHPKNKGNYHFIEKCPTGYHTVDYDEYFKFRESSTNNDEHIEAFWIDNILNLPAAGVDLGGKLIYQGYRGYYMVRYGDISEYVTYFYFNNRDLPFIFSRPSGIRTSIRCIADNNE